MAKSNKIATEGIKIQVVDSKASNFFIQDIEEIDFNKVALKDLEFGLHVVTATKIEDKLFKVELDIEVLHKDHKQKKALFGIKSTTVFNIPEFSKIVNKKDEVIAPEEFTRKLLNISIGGLRGMLSVYLNNTELNHITLPLFDLSSAK